MAARKMSIRFPVAAQLKGRINGLAELETHLIGEYYKPENTTTQRYKLDRMRTAVAQLLRESQSQLKWAEKYAKMRPSTKARIEVING